jgi:hypothetical protein
MGRHHGVVRRAEWMAAGSVLLALSGVAMAAVAGIAATACTVTVKIVPKGPAVLGGIALSPSAATVQVGGCVGFRNTTTASVTVTVTGTSSYKATLASGGSASFSPHKAGSDVMKATHLLASAAGTLTVSPAPKPTPTPTSGSPTPSGGHSSTPTTRPDVAPSSKHSKHPGHPGHRGNPNPQPTGVQLPPLPPLPSNGVTALPLGTNPLVAPGPTSAAPTSGSTTPSPSAAVVAGPIEPADDDRRGLPEAVSVVLVLGLASGWGRVLLAQPEAVDDASRGDHRL